MSCKQNDLILEDRYERWEGQNCPFAGCESLNLEITIYGVICLDCNSVLESPKYSCRDDENDNKEE
jgi:hypothetical protein